MKKTWLAGILSATSLLAAEALDLSGYKALPKSGTSENLIKNPSFLEGDKYWDMKNCPEFEIGPFGPNNVPALRQVRNGKRKGSTVGVSTNVIEASLIALVDSMKYAVTKDAE